MPKYIEWSPAEMFQRIVRTRKMALGLKIRFLCYGVYLNIAFVEKIRMTGPHGRIPPVKAICSDRMK